MYHEKKNQGSRSDSIELRITAAVERMQTTNAISPRSKCKSHSPVAGRCPVYRTTNGGVGISPNQMQERRAG